MVDKETGRRKGIHYSWLTEEIGVLELQEHLFALITLAKACVKIGIIFTGCFKRLYF